MCARSLVIGLFLALVTHAAAQAQYGLEEEPRQTETAPGVVPQAAKPPVTLSMETALATFNEYRAAALNADSAYLLSTLADPERSRASKIITEKGIRHYWQENETVARWDVECAACWDDAKEGRLCMITASRTLVNSRSYWPNVYALKAIDGQIYITEQVFRTSKRGRKLRKRGKKERRFCDLGALALAVNDSGNASSSGTSSLMRGLSAVVKALGQ